MLNLFSAARSKKNNFSVEDDEELEISGRVVGTVRRHIPLDTRDPPGAILHFYVGDSYNPNRLAYNYQAGILLYLFRSLNYHVS